MLINRYAPPKTIRGRKNLPWVTQEIRRNMNKRDHLYQVQKSSGKDADRLLFKKVKYEVDFMITTSYNNYLDSLVGVIDDSPGTDGARPNSKKLFSYLKNCRQELKAVLPSKRMTSYVLIMLRRLVFLTISFSRFLHPSHPLPLNWCAHKKSKTFKNQITSFPKVFQMKLGINTITCKK